MKSPTYEMRIVVEMFDNKWYPAGSDTPVPKEAIVEIYDGGVNGPEDLA